MKPNSVRLSIAALAVVAALGAFVLPAAKSQVAIGPSYAPIGVSASGNASTAWFHEPSTGRVMACQTAGTPAAGLSTIQCVTAKLP